MAICAEHPAVRTQARSRCTVPNWTILQWLCIVYWWGDVYFVFYIPHILVIIMEAYRAQLNRCYIGSHSVAISFVYCNTWHFQKSKIIKQYLIDLHCVFSQENMNTASHVLYLWSWYRLWGDYRLSRKEEKETWFYVTGSNVMRQVISIRNPPPDASLTSSNYLKNPLLSPTVEFLRVFFPHQMKSVSNGGILCAEEQQNIVIIIIANTGKNKATDVLVLKDKLAVIIGTYRTELCTFALTIYQLLTSSWK